MKYKSHICFAFLVSLLVLNVPALADKIDKSPEQNVDYSRYMRIVQRRIKRDWHPPKMKKSTRAVVIFKISKTGEIRDVTIDKPSLYTETDQAVLDAVNAANPLPPPPGSEDINIQFTFDYNVSGQPPKDTVPDFSKFFNRENSQILGFVVGFLLVLSLIIYKLATLGKPPRDDTHR